jgi:hypothetical protein
MPNYQRDLSADFVREILDYDPKTGIFRWKYRLDREANWNSRWVGKTAGYPIKGHIRIQIAGKPGYYAGPLAWLYMTGEWPPDQVDHRDLDRGNNRWTNLRLADNSQNNCNREAQANSRSGIRGVQIHGGRWRARITARGRTYELGYFVTVQEAVAAYAVAAKELHGEFARAHRGVVSTVP